MPASSERDRDAEAERDVEAHPAHEGPKRQQRMPAPLVGSSQKPCCGGWHGLSGIDVPFSAAFLRAWQVAAGPDNTPAARGGRASGRAAAVAGAAVAESLNFSDADRGRNFDSDQGRCMNRFAALDRRPRRWPSPPPARPRPAPRRPRPRRRRSCGRTAPRRRSRPAVAAGDAAIALPRIKRAVPGAEDRQHQALAHPRLSRSGDRRQGRLRQRRRPLPDAGLADRAGHAATT